MGQRLRLKASFVIPANWTKEEKALVLGLKKYGAMLVDNSSSFFSISITPDDRWPANAFSDIASTGIGISNFEVIQTTGPNQGPRSPGAPVAAAGPDQMVPLGVPLRLQDAVLFSNVPPTILWKLYSGAGCGDVRKRGTDQYDSDLQHAGRLHAGVERRRRSSRGGLPPFVVEHAGTLPAGTWSGSVTTSLQNSSVPLTNRAAYSRIRGQ